MSTIELTDNTEGLLNYLRIHVEAREKFGMGKLKGYYYSCMEEFVLDAGRAFPEISPHQPTPGKRNRYRPRMMKRCFHNARNTASASKGKLRYVEGYALSTFMPVLHGWNIDEEDRVVDTTWCGSGEDWDHRPKVGVAYYGVVFPIEHVRATSTNDNTSMIDRWQDGYPLLRKKWAA